MEGIMESVIRKLVEEEVSKAIKKKTEKEETIVVKDSPTKEEPPMKKQRTAKRITKLLASVNQKGNKAKANKSIPLKPMKIQIRWRKQGEESFIMGNNGGGTRFVQFDNNEDPTFSELLDKGKSYYFPNNENSFGETLDDVLCKILTAGGQRIKNDVFIRQYLADNGCFPSKTYFIFETVDLSELNDSDNDDDIPPVLATKYQVPSSTDAIAGTSQKKICRTCYATYFDFCLRCEQDKEFQESLEADRAKDSKENDHEIRNVENEENSGIRNLENQENPGISNVENERNLEIGDMREKRLSFFQTATNDSYMDSLATIRSRFKTTEWEHKKFSIRRRYVVKDVLKKMKIFFEDKPLEPVKATFLSCDSQEAAVDDGGPMRELVSLFFEKVNGIITHGPPNNQVLLHDSEMLRNKDYFFFGKFVALCILQGHDTPKQFAKNAGNKFLRIYCDT